MRLLPLWLLLAGVFWLSAAEPPARKASPRQFDYANAQPEMLDLVLHYPNGVHFATRVVLPPIGFPDSIQAIPAKGLPYARTYRFDRRPAPGAPGP